TDAGRRAVRELVAAAPSTRRPRLVYVLDAAIPGAAAARNAGIERARGDVLLFCDDDVVPEPAVIERLLAHLAATPGLDGVAPVITNYPAPSAARRWHQALFCRGPFRDERQPVYWFWQRHAAAARCVPVRMFTGAMMAFRRAALDGVRYDPRYRGPSTGEDIDLCWSLVARGRRLAIALDARIVHNRAPRPASRPEATMIASWGYLYRKHLRRTPATRAAFAWYVAGVVIGALAQVARERNLAPLRSAFAGIRAVLRDFEGVGFLAPVREERPAARGGGSSRPHGTVARRRRELDQRIR
ncbi:MAG TPA: glycosyltransferase, partial [Candidatus Tectomicrobia bacterium]|nr:glycosyltransferase [Candidatus Tectomicrobia bacterium]